MNNAREMMSRPGGAPRSFAARLAVKIAKLAMLAGTAAALVATTYVPPCSERESPTAFLASGTCGPGGVVVVSVGPYAISLSNAAALGLPPVGPGLSVASTEPRPEKLCDLDLAEGGWGFTWSSCPADGAVVDTRSPASRSLDGGIDGGAAGAGGAGGRDNSAAGGASGAAGLTQLACLRGCSARKMSDGSLSFTCTDSKGAELCASRLTKWEGR